MLPQVLAFLFYPRTSIRALVGTEPWLVVIASSLTDGLLFSVAVAEMPAEKIPQLFGPPAIPLIFVGISLFAAVWLYASGWLRNRSAREFGGRASAWELSAAIAWSTLPWQLYFILGLVVAPFLAAFPDFGKNHLLLAYSMLALGPVCLVWGCLLIRSSILELQGFSPAEGRAAAWNAVLLERSWFFLFAVAVMGGVIALSWLARAFR